MPVFVGMVFQFYLNDVDAATVFMIVVVFFSKLYRVQITNYALKHTYICIQRERNWLTCVSMYNASLKWAKWIAV